MKGSPFMGSGTSLDPFGTCHSPFTASHTTSDLRDAYDRIELTLKEQSAAAVLLASELQTRCIVQVSVSFKSPGLLKMVIHTVTLRISLWA